MFGIGRLGLAVRLPKFVEFGVLEFLAVIEHEERSSKIAFLLLPELLLNNPFQQYLTGRAPCQPVLTRKSFGQNANWGGFVGVNRFCCPIRTVKAKRNESDRIGFWPNALYGQSR